MNKTFLMTKIVVIVTTLVEMITVKIKLDVSSGSLSMCKFEFFFDIVRGD